MLTHDDKEIGEAHCEDGKWSVKFTIEYQTAHEEWFAPLAHLLTSLPRFPEYAPPEPELVYEITDDAIEEVYSSSQTLTEKQIRAGGYAWRFYKDDVDPWPSLLHGHCYEQHLKLDAITGIAFNVGTKEKRFIDKTRT